MCCISCNLLKDSFIIQNFFQRENKRISLHQVEQDEVEQDQHQQHHHQQQQQHQQHQQQQQQLALILSHLEGQQLDEHQLGLLLTHLEGLSFEQQQVLGHQLETQRQQQQGVQQQNDVEVNGEPIYQNQGQIIASEGLEPIYQNLPLPKLEEVGFLNLGNNRCFDLWDFYNSYLILGAHL